MKTLHVMDFTFNYKAALRGYESAVMTRAWNGIGSLELVINSGIPNADLIQQDDLIWFDNEYHKAFVVEKIEATQDGSAKLYQITASHLNVLLKDFITMPPSGSEADVRSGTREQVVRAWVDANCINPTDAGRAQYPIALGTIQGLGGAITEQTRLKVLSDEVTRILAAGDLGWRLDLDIPNEQFVFTVLEGIDRTTGQSTNSRVIFGVKYGNIAGYRRIKDRTAARNVAYVGGQGEGALREIVEVDAAGAGRRREIFVDARDLEDSADLPERGLQTLASLSEVDSYEFEVVDRQFVYERDYDLGDFITVVMDKDDYQDLQIQKIQEIYEQGSIRVIPEFGKPELTIGSAISSVTKRITSLETAALPGVIPPGCVTATASTAIPAGWLECNGQAVSREAYPTLFTAISTTYGPGDGSTTFNVPNIKGRVIAGQDTGQTEFDTIGETGGAKTHTLSITEIPSHSHSIPAQSDTTPDGGTAAPASEDASDITLTEPTGSAGGGAAHNNLQPYIVLRYIIKF